MYSVRVFSSIPILHAMKCGSTRVLVLHLTQLGVHIVLVSQSRKTASIGRCTLLLFCLQVRVHGTVSQQMHRRSCGRTVNTKCGIHLIIIIFHQNPVISDTQLRLTGYTGRNIRAIQSSGLGPRPGKLLVHPAAMWFRNREDTKCGTTGIICPSR
jgi:hypothetical protein